MKLIKILASQKTAHMEFRKNFERRHAHFAVEFNCALDELQSTETSNSLHIKQDTLGRHGISIDDIMNYLSARGFWDIRRDTINHTGITVYWYSDRIRRNICTQFENNHPSFTAVVGDALTNLAKDVTKNNLHITLETIRKHNVDFEDVVSYFIASGFYEIDMTNGLRVFWPSKRVVNKMKCVHDIIYRKRTKHESEYNKIDESNLGGEYNAKY